MKNSKTLGFILFGVGIILSAITLLFLPAPAYGLYLLIGQYKPGMGDVPKILISVIGALVIVMAVATIISFMLY